MVSPEPGSVAEKSRAQALSFFCHLQSISDIFSYNLKGATTEASMMFSHSNVQKQEGRSELFSYDSLFSQKVKCFPENPLQTSPYIALSRNNWLLGNPTNKSLEKFVSEIFG